MPRRFIGWLRAPYARVCFAKSTFGAALVPPDQDGCGSLNHPGFHLNEPAPGSTGVP